MSTDKKTKEIAMAAVNALSYGGDEIIEILKDITKENEKISLQLQHRMIELAQYLSQKSCSCVNALIKSNDVQ